MSNDPLQELLLDSVEIDRARLASALKDILGIDKNTGKIILKPGFNSLSAKDKVLAFLLGKKAAFLLEVIESEAVSAKNITEEVGIPDGTVRPKFKELFDGRIITQASAGEYYVADHQILLAIDALSREE